MSYATLADLIAAFGEHEVIAVTDRTNTGLVDSAVALEALERASSEADTYLAVRYPLPLPSVPKALVAAVCDMARYRLTGAMATETDPIADRYKAAVAWLKSMAEGKAVLPGLVQPAPAGGGVQLCPGTRGWLAPATEEA